MTVDVAKITAIGESLSRNTALLGTDVRKSIRVDTIYRSQTIKTKTALLRTREITYNKLAAGLRTNQSGTGGIGGIIEWLIGGEAARRIFRKFRPGGRGPGGGGRITFGKGSGGPKLGGGLGGGLLRKGGLGRSLSKAGLKRVPFLDIAFGAMEYGDRRNQGQTQGQAIGGALAQTGGSIGGGLIGQALIPVPVLGYVIGSMIGSTVTTTIFDKLTGADKLKSGAEARRILEEDKYATEKSLFGASLDKFDSTLERFEQATPVLMKTSMVTNFEKEFPSLLDKLPTPKPPNTNKWGAGEIALDVLSIGLMVLSLADNVIGLWGVTEVPAAANLVIRLRKYRRVLEFFGLMKKRHGKTYVRPESNNKVVNPKNRVVNPKKKKYGTKEKVNEARDQATVDYQIKEGEYNYSKLGKDIQRQLLEQELGLKPGTLQPNYGRGIQGDLFDTPIPRNYNPNAKFSDGGSGTVNAPESGANITMTFHGKEDFVIVPRENQFTRSRGRPRVNTIVINRSSPATMGNQLSGSGVVPVTNSEVAFVRASPFDTATKYYQIASHSKYT